jgi:hypothetical protein
MACSGACEWVDPPDTRPDELTDGMAIDCASVRIGRGWWQDMYFGWYFGFEPALVARSLAESTPGWNCFSHRPGGSQGGTNG